ncbi:nitroreductase family protein [Novosphingobium cyanobacteriorum]|uniref:Nitroreductase family protein n=1 Tax=Novosphingobium cyanobacteriorum TaxID=3024215 RepID=A0ABT6CF98_9SPHN|nr:nitroreductase family protein [Novosphingobium cyanobacteriorum]MDF8331770.1 nitroreductase family protein [Novosphingobium cyanobacteriorum]
MTRSTPRPVHPQFLERWSPRAFDGSVLDEETLLTLFDAAHWAPSAFNYQPWRFVWALQGDANWDALLGLLVPANAAWASKAGALVFVLSDRLFVSPMNGETSPATTASFDAGAAWASLALQAHAMGLHTHAMAGYDHARAPDVLGAGERFKVEAAVAIGRIGNREDLPEAMQKREFPSPRKPVEEIAFAGKLTEG